MTTARRNPPSAVRTSRDERLWELAKKSYARQRRRGTVQGEKWSYIMATFQRMKKRKGGKKTAVARGGGKMRKNSAAVVRGDKVRRVKNLGWLIRHASQVKSFEVARNPDPRWDALLIAHMTDGAKYVTDFADISILKAWLLRPSFEGLKVRWAASVPMES